MLNKLKILFFIVFFYFAQFSCVDYNKSNYIFTKWVEDTISIIYNSDVSFKKDSNFLQISEKICFVIDSSNLKSNSTLLSILNDYKQIPNNYPYQLSYERIDLFTKSRIKRFLYERFTEYKDINLSYKNIEISYNYIRGRINSAIKQVKINDTTHVRIYYNFKNRNPEISQIDTIKINSQHIKRIK